MRSHRKASGWLLWRLAVAGMFAGVATTVVSLGEVREEPNQFPRLEDGRVEPMWGVAGETTFVYQVTYYDTLGPVDYFSADEADPGPSEFGRAHPRIAIDPEGNTHVVYMQTGSAGQWEIYYVKMDSSSNLIGKIRVSDDDGAHSVFPSIALDSHGDAHIVWADNRNSGVWEIYYSKATTCYELPPPTPYLVDLTFPDFPVSDLDGHNSGRVVPDVFGRIVIVDDDVYTLFLEHPDINVDSYDNIHIVWSDARHYPLKHDEIYYQKQSNDPFPSVLIDDMRISGVGPGDGDSGPPGVHTCPVIAVDHRDRVHIAWQLRVMESGGDILYQKQDCFGNVVTDDIMLTESNWLVSAMPDIAVDDDGYVHIVWMEQKGQDQSARWEIHALALDPDGYKLWEKRQSDMGLDAGGCVSHSGLADGSSMYPRIAVHGGNTGGVTYIVWHDKRHGDWEIYSSQIPNGQNTPHHDARVTNNPLSDLYPDLALFSANEDMVVESFVWQRDSAGVWTPKWIPPEMSEADINVPVLPSAGEGGGGGYPYRMFQADPSDTDGRDGIVYVWGTQLPEGFYEFRFRASNGIGRDSLGPFFGPVVTSGELEATVDINPDVLNRRSQGRWITSYIELPPGFDPVEIDVPTVCLEYDGESVPAELWPTSVGDYDQDGIPDRMVKFDRQGVIDLFPPGFNGEAELWVKGELHGGIPFAGKDTIRVIGGGGPHGLEKEILPQVCSLSQASPNPFSIATTIRYTVPDTAWVTFKVYNIAGELVRTLVDEPKTPGYYAVSWDGEDGHGDPVSRGVYFYRLDSPRFTSVKTLIVVR